MANEQSISTTSPKSDRKKYLLTRLRMMEQKYPPDAYKKLMVEPDDLLGFVRECMKLSNGFSLGEYDDVRWKHG